MIFRLVSKSVTLNDLEWRNGPYSALFHRNSIAFVAHCVKVVEDIPKLSATEMTICGYTILVCTSDSGQLSLLLSVRLEVSTSQRTAQQQCSVAGKATVGLALHRLCVTATYGLSCLRKRDEHPAYTPVRSTEPFTLEVLRTKCETHRLLIKLNA